MKIGHDWGMIEAILFKYMNVTWDSIQDTPVVKLFEFFDWGVYFMQMESFLASSKL